jgi:hypothetical protein
VRTVSEAVVPKKRKPTSRKVVTKAAVAPAARDTRRSAPRGDAGEEAGPAREREQPEELIRGAADDDLAEELGEEFVESATSGEQAAEDMRDEEVPEESGGPFVETTANSEFAYGTDASNPEDAERAPFPTTRREK